MRETRCGDGVGQPAIASSPTQMSYFVPIARERRVRIRQATMALSGTLPTPRRTEEDRMAGTGYAPPDPMAASYGAMVPLPTRAAGHPVTDAGQACPVGF